MVRSGPGPGGPRSCSPRGLMVLSSASWSFGLPLDMSAAMENALAREESCGLGDDVYSMVVGTRRRKRNQPTQHRTRTEADRMKSKPTVGGSPAAATRADTPRRNPNETKPPRRPIALLSSCDSVYLLSFPRWTLRDVVVVVLQLDASSEERLRVRGGLFTGAALPRRSP